MGNRVVAPNQHRQRNMDKAREATKRWFNKVQLEDRIMVRLFYNTLLWLSTADSKWRRSIPIVERHEEYHFARIERFITRKLCLIINAKCWRYIRQRGQQDDGYLKRHSCCPGGWDFSPAAPDGVDNTHGQSECPLSMSSQDLYHESSLTASCNTYPRISRQNL